MSTAPKLNALQKLLQEKGVSKPVARVMESLGGAEVYIRKLSGKQVADLGKQNKGNESHAAFQLVAVSVCDADGVLLLSPADMHQPDSSVLKEFVKHINDVNGFNQDKEEAGNA